MCDSLQNTLNIEVNACGYALSVCFLMALYRKLPTRVDLPVPVAPAQNIDPRYSSQPSTPIGSSNKPQDVLRYLATPLERAFLLSTSK